MRFEDFDNTKPRDVPVYCSKCNSLRGFANSEGVSFPDGCPACDWGRKFDAHSNRKRQE